MSQSPTPPAAGLSPTAMTSLRECLIALIDARDAVGRPDWTTAYPAAWARFTSLLDAAPDPMVRDLLDPDRRRIEAYLLDRTRKASLEEITTADLEAMGQRRAWEYTELAGWTGRNGSTLPLDTVVVIDALLRDPEMLRMIRRVRTSDLRATAMEMEFRYLTIRLAGVMRQMENRNPAQHALLTPVFRAGADALAAQSAAHGRSRPTLRAMREALQAVPLPTDDGRTLWDFLDEIARLPQAEFGEALMRLAVPTGKLWLSPALDATPTTFLRAILSGESVRHFERRMRAAAAARHTSTQARSTAARDTDADDTAEAPTVVRRSGARR